MVVKIAVVIYSTYGHILTLSKAEVEGVKASGAEVDMFQLPSAEQNDASASAGIPVITPSKLAEYDGVIFGLPSRFGSHPYAFKAFLDATGAQWATGSYYGKYVAFFVTSGTQGGGQETVIRNSITATSHHGFIFVPLGYDRAFGEITNLQEPHGGSPWGAGSLAGASGTRQPSQLELDTARIQGKSFAETVARGIGKPLSGTSDAGAAAGGAAGAADSHGASGAMRGVDGYDISGNNAHTVTEPGVAGSTLSGPSDGAAGASGAAGSSGVAGGAKDLEGQAKDTVDGYKTSAENAQEDAASKVTDAKQDATAAPKRTEQVEEKAGEAAKKEKNGCCSCM